MRRTIVVVGGLVLVLAAPAPGQETWPMQGRDQRHQGRSPVLGPAIPALEWSFDLDYRLQDNASPIVGPDGTVYQPSEGALYAIHPDGTLKWSFPTSSTRSAPALSPDGGVIYVYSGGFASSLHALDTASGTELWGFPIGTVSYASVTVGADGTIVIGDVGGRLFGIRPDGTEKWRWQDDPTSSCGIEAPAAIDALGRIYLAHNCWGLVSLDAEGNRRWIYQDGGFGGYGWPTPAIGPDGTIYVGGGADYGQSSARAIRPDGTLKWTSDDEDESAFFRGLALSADGSIVYRAKAGSIQALAAATGNLLWRGPSVDPAETFGGALALGGNGILYAVGYTNKKVYAFSAADGTPLWEYELNTYPFYWGPQSPALGPDGTLYVVASGTVPASGDIPGRLYAFAPPAPGVDLAITQSHDGDFFVGSPGVYGLRVVNVGAAITSGAITVTDILPAGLTFSSATGAGWSCTPSGQIVTCTHPGPLGSGGVLALALTTGVSGGAMPNVTNVATVSTPGDLSAANNSTSGPTAVHAQCVSGVSPSNASFDDLGGTGSTEVTTSSTCTWTAVATAPWINVTFGASGLGNGTVGYSVSSNNSTSSRTGAIRIGPLSFSITQTRQSCLVDVSLYTSTGAFDRSGGIGEIRVDAASGCSWSATPKAGWISILSGSSGTGAGTVTFSVAPNATGSARDSEIDFPYWGVNVWQDAVDCPPIPLVSGQTIQGALATTDCQSPMRGGSNNTHYADRYTFTASSGHRVAIALSSSELDSFLYLLAPNGYLEGVDNDGGGGQNARIPPESGFFRLPQGGTYVIEVTDGATVLGSTGAYTLSFENHDLVFQDDFEAGDLSAWSSSEPGEGGVDGEGATTPAPHRGAGKRAVPGTVPRTSQGEISALAVGSRSRR